MGRQKDIVLPLDRYTVIVKGRFLFRARPLHACVFLRVQERVGPAVGQILKLHHGLAGMFPPSLPFPPLFRMLAVYLRLVKYRTRLCAERKPRTNANSARRC